MDNLSSNLKNNNFITSNLLKKFERLLYLTKQLLRYRPKTVKHSIGQTSFEFIGYRHYVPGDAVREIDWNVFQRLNEIVVKQYAVESPDHWVIGLDISASMSVFGKFECALQLTAALIYIALSLNNKVTFFTFPSSSKIYKYKGKHKIKIMLDNLAQLIPDQIKAEQFDPLTLFPKLPQHSKSILISDFYDKSYHDILPMLSKRNICSVALHIIALQEIKPDFKGHLILKDIETSNTKKVHVSPYLLKQYEEQFQKVILRFKVFCSKHKVFYKKITPNSALDREVLSILRLVGLLR